MMTPFELRKCIQCNQVYFKINFNYVLYITPIYPIKIYVEFMIPNDRYYTNVKNIVHKSFQF